jgi:hypothetical protein
MAIACIVDERIEWTQALNGVAHLLCHLRGVGARHAGKRLRPIQRLTCLVY